MYYPHKMSGKFSLEYLVHLCECLEKHGSISDYFIFSQNGIQRFEVRYDVEDTKLFEIKMLKPITDNQLDLLIETYSLERATASNEDDSYQTLTADIDHNVARAMIFGPNSLLNSEEAFELDSEFAQNVFSETKFESKFIYPPYVNITLLFFWASYEFIKYSISNEYFHLGIGNIDVVEGLLFGANCFFFWGTKPYQDDIPVFKEGTSSNFSLYKQSTSGCVNLMIILIIVSFGTS